MKSFAKFIFFAAFVLQLLFISGCSKPAEPNPVNPPMWLVESADSGGRVYLLGSMHVGIAGTEYPDYVLNAYESSSVVLCELDSDELSANRDLLMDSVSVLMCEDGKSAKDYLGDDYEEIKQFFTDKGIYTSALENFKPPFWVSMISSKVASECGFSSEYGTEKIFIDKAKADGKPIVELETAEEQYSSMAAMSHELQIYTLKDTINDYQRQIDAMYELYNSWKNDSGLEEICNRVDLPLELISDYNDYYETMYSARQQRMANAVAEQLEAGETVFMFVGTAHFYAHPSIIDFLSEQGFSPVKISNSGLENAA